jgi:hypothetical protein
MHGSKWADYIIIAVRKDALNRITDVQIGPDPITGNTVNASKKSKDDVIDLIDNGKTVITSYGKTKGALVEHVGGYLRTTPNCHPLDNLDYLPTF